MSKRRSFVRRKLGAGLRDFVKQNVWPICALAALYLSAVGLSLLLGGRGYWAGFAAGAELVSFIAAFLLLFLLHTGAVDQVAGAYGETRTTEELEKARKAGSIHGAVHNIELAEGDIDSVVFTPAGILALETKWRTRELDRRWLRRDVAQAQRSADKARAVLRSKNVDAGVHAVTPVLVIWGKGSLDVADGGETVDGVSIVDGNELKQWLTKFREGPLTRQGAEQPLAALRGFALRGS